jgi:hypothetical protein
MRKTGRVTGGRIAACHREWDSDIEPTAEHGGAAQQRRRARGVSGGELTLLVLMREFSP